MRQTTLFLVELKTMVRAPDAVNPLSVWLRR
jgi:hypothetical protein